MRRTLSWVAAVLVCIAAGVASCGGSDSCLVYDENCSTSYRQAHGNADCCDGTTCQEDLQGYMVCR